MKKFSPARLSAGTLAALMGSALAMTPIAPAQAQNGIAIVADKTNDCDSFGFKATGRLPKHTRMRLTWKIDGVEHSKTIGATKWHSGDTQLWWTDAKAELVTRDGGQVLATSDVLQPVCERPVVHPNEGATATSFGFNVTGFAPEGSQLRITWMRDGQQQFTTVDGTSWWSGDQQAGWSDAKAEFIVAGKVVSTAGLMRPDFALTQTGRIRKVADGLTVTDYAMQTPAGYANAHLMAVDLTKVRTDLLTAPKVASNQRLDVMAKEAGAIAAINADFFQNTRDAKHTNIPITGASVGVEIRDGQMIKSAVVKNQRHGETMPQPLNNGTEVIGANVDGQGVVTRVAFSGQITSEALGAPVAIHGLNIYGMGRNQISLFDSQWGSRSRQRAACGTEGWRLNGCTADTHEVILTDGVVTSVSGTYGSGEIAANQQVLTGREAGAVQLRKLKVGDKVEVSHQYTVENRQALEWAVGGGIVVADGAVVPNIDAKYGPMPRPFAGYSADGNTMYVLAVDGRDNVSVGISTQNGAALVRYFGAHNAVQLDGGGSETMLVRSSAENPFELITHSRVEGIEVLREIPNGIGIFTK